MSRLTSARRIDLPEFSGVRGGITEEHSYDENLHLSLASKRRAESEGDTVGAGNAARAAAECYRRLGRIADAERHYCAAARLLSAAGDQKGVGWTLLTYGNMLRQNSDFIEAIRVLSQTRQVAKTCHDTKLLAYLEAGIAECNRISGNYPQAYRQHHKVLSFFQELEDARGIVWALEGIGQILRNIGRVDEALEVFDCALKLAKRTNDIRGLAYAYKCHAECLSLCDHPFSALEEIAMALALFQQMGLKVGTGFAFKAQGDILVRSCKHEAAIASYTDALSTFNECQDSRGVGYTLNGLARLLGKMGCPGAAWSFFLQASSFFSKAGINLGRDQADAGTHYLLREGILSKRLLRDVADHSENWDVASETALLAERPDLVKAARTLLARYRREKICYKRVEKAKVWEGAKHADCSSFVQHVLIESGYGSAREGRLTTRRLERDPKWSEFFEEHDGGLARPGDIILQNLEGRRHMGVLTGFQGSQPMGIQMGVKTHASEIVWIGNEFRFFRVRDRR